MGFGRNSFVGWAEESTWGTPVAPSKYAELISETMKGIRTRTPRPVVRDLDQREGSLYDEKEGAEGGFLIEASYDGLLRLLEHAFGDVSIATAVDTPETGAHTHTITPKATLMSGKGLSVSINTDTDSGGLPEKRVEGFKINTLKMSYDPLRNVQFEVTGAGQDFSQVVVSTPAFPADTVLVAGHQLVFSINDTPREVDNLEWTLDNGMNLDHRVLGDKQIIEPVRSDTKRALTGSITVDALEEDLDKFRAGTLFDLDIDATGPIAAAATNFSWKVAMTKCLVTDDPFNVTTPGQIKSTIPFMALLPAAGSIMTMVIINTENAVA